MCSILRIATAFAWLLYLSGAVSANTSPFWIVVELRQIEWRDGCLTTAFCAQPKFHIRQSLKEEIIVRSWPVTPELAQDSVPFTTEWESGTLSDLTLSCQVVGIDPTYGFPRTCDETRAVRALNEDPVISSQLRDELSTLPPSTADKPEIRLVQFRAKCFNVTLAVQKFTERCPTCPDPSEVHIIEQLPAHTPYFSFLSSIENEGLAGYAILAAIAAMLTVLLALLCVLHIRLRRKTKGMSRSNRTFQAYPPPPIVDIRKLRHSDEEYGRYDMPWEQQSRPLHQYAASRASSDATVMSPLESTSSMGGFVFRPPNRGAEPPFRIVPVGGQPNNNQKASTTRLSGFYHDISPNSSMLSTRANDSGLESA